MKKMVMCQTLAIAEEDQELILNDAPPVPGDCVLSCLKSESDAEGLPFLKSVSPVDRFRTHMNTLAT